MKEPLNLNPQSILLKRYFTHVVISAVLTLIIYYLVTKYQIPAPKYYIFFSFFGFFYAFAIIGYQKTHELIDHLSHFKHIIESFSEKLEELEEKIDSMYKDLGWRIDTIDK